jgi:hypothetical protein
MADLNQICAEVTGSLPDGIGCAVIDLESGLLIGVAHHSSDLPSSLLDTMAASVVEMFTGRNVTVVEDMLAQYSGNKRTRMLEGLQLTTDKAYVFMSIVPDKPSYLVAVVSGKRATLGAGWAAVRGAMPKISPLCP